MWNQLQLLCNLINQTLAYAEFLRQLRSSWNRAANHLHLTDASEYLLGELARFHGFTGAVQIATLLAMEHVHCIATQTSLGGGAGGVTTGGVVMGGGFEIATMSVLSACQAPSWDTTWSTGCRFANALHPCTPLTWLRTRLVGVTAANVTLAAGQPIRPPDPGVTMQTCRLTGVAA